jgi:hypothetical protein
VLEFGRIHFGGLNTGRRRMNKETPDFMMAFFDYVPTEEKKLIPDLPAKKQETLKFTDNFTIFKVENQCKIII